MNILEKYPRQVGLFVFSVFILVCYMIALFNKLPTTVLEGLLWALGGGLVAELTGQRQTQHIDVETIRNAEIQTPKE